MTVSSANASPQLLGSSVPPRPVEEVVVSRLFGPLADLVVRLLLPLRFPPPAVVLTHAAVGVLAALAIYQRAFVLAAVLLQLRTLLDNVDGRLARASGRVSVSGRYLDTEMDLVVNAALCAALASTTGAPWLALTAFVALTVLLSIDFDVGRLFREARADEIEQPSRSGSMAERVLDRVYDVVFAPQDRAVRSLSERRLERVTRGCDDASRLQAARLAYYDRVTVTVLANLGLSTQLLVLGALLLLDAPAVYLWLVVASLGLLPILQLRRERLARRALAA